MCLFSLITKIKTPLQKDFKCTIKGVWYVYCLLYRVTVTECNARRGVFYRHTQEGAGLLHHMTPNAHLKGNTRLGLGRTFSSRYVAHNTKESVITKWSQVSFKKTKKRKNVEFTAEIQQRGEKREAASKHKQFFMRTGMRSFPRITNNSLFSFWQNQIHLMHSWNVHNAADVQILKQSRLAADVYLHVVQQWRTERKSRRFSNALNTWVTIKAHE